MVLTTLVYWRNGRICRLRTRLAETGRTYLRKSAQPTHGSSHHAMGVSVFEGGGAAYPLFWCAVAQVALAAHASPHSGFAWTSLRKHLPKSLLARLESVGTANPQDFSGMIAWTGDSPHPLRCSMLCAWNRGGAWRQHWRTVRLTAKACGLPAAPGSATRDVTGALSASCGPSSDCEPFWPLYQYLSGMQRGRRRAKGIQVQTLRLKFRHRQSSKGEGMRTLPAANSGIAAGEIKSSFHAFISCSKLLSHVHFHHDEAGLLNAKVGPELLALCNCCAALCRQEVRQAQHSPGGTRVAGISRRPARGWPRGAFQLSLSRYLALG